MSDILDELAKIKDAERTGEKRIAEAKKRGEKAVQDAKSDLSAMTGASEQEFAKIKKDLEENYKRTTALMLTKLDKDYKIKLSAIKNIDIQKLMVNYKQEITQALKTYGSTTPKKTE